MKVKAIYVFSILLFIMLMITGCGTAKSSPREKTNEKLTVYTTVYPLKDFTEKIGAPYVTVESIYPPNVDEHSFEPSQKDIIEIVEADVFFHIGFGLEGFVNKTKPILEDEGVVVAAIGEEIHFVEDHVFNETVGHEKSHEGHEHGTIDPHVWIDPLYAKQMAETITEYLSQMLPEHKEHFEANMNDLAQQFDQLHEQFMQITANAKHDTIIVSHAAFNYWSLRYDLKQLSIAGISPSQEPSQKQLQTIIDEVKSHNLQYILVEQNVSSRLVDVVAREAGLKSLPIHNLATLTEKELDRGEDYFSLMEKNLNTLEKALNE